MALLASTPATTAPRITASLDVPQTQNTAPVLEFQCLFSHDLRRKQKRWQDGRLKFHTFNKRVMIYDERSNFVGDTHWRDDGDITEGEELQLDRGGILVEVGECLGKRDQDLTELLGKRAHEKEERAAAKLANPSPITLVGPFQDARSPAGTLKPKPLNLLLAPSGHYGRAMVPNISPFEERQRLEKYNHIEEASRPTKKRKVNDPAQNKGGYAQNLMGATLTLGSSTPLSTAAVRYDLPKPNITRPPAPTIDLSLHDSDGRNAIAEKPSKFDHQVPEARQAPVRRAASRRIPPPKSGYASNLTGAALALSGPGVASVRRPLKTLATDKLPRTRQHENETFIDIDLSLNQPGAMKNSEDLIVQESKTVRGRNVSNIDNCRSVDTLQPALNPTRSTETSIRDTTDPTPEKSASSLRIKARPPRKMMMLMDRSSPRPRNGYSGKTGLESNNGMKPLQSTKDPVLSQDTMHLDSFYQNQEEKLRACLNGKRKSTNLDLEEHDEPPSLPSDNGASHRTIDLRLSQEGNDTELIAQATLDCGPAPLQRPLTRPGNAIRDTTLSECIGGPRGKDERLSGPSTPRDDRGSHGNVPLQPTSTENAEEKLGVAVTPTQQRPKQRPDYADQSSSSPAHSPRNRKPVNTRTAWKSDSKENHIDLAVKDNSSHLVSEMADKLLSDQVPCPVSTGPRFRKQQPRAAAGILSLEVNPVEQAEPFWERPSGPAKPELALSDLFVDGVPENISKQKVAPGIKPPNDIGFQSANQFNVACLARDASISASDHHDKVTLVNPATRGKSVQSAVATDDAMTNVSGTLVPSLVRLSPRPVPEPTSGARRGGAWSGSAGGESVTGPWSRESFDLFGLWLPPGTERLGGGTA